MRKQSTTNHLLGSASVLALSAAAFLASSAARPATAATITQGVYAGGSTLASEAFRAIFDCYDGTLVGGDNYTFAAGVGPSHLPTQCTTWTSPLHPTHHVQGMYAGVGSGNGFRAYIANDPSQWYAGTLTPGAVNLNIAPPFPPAQPPFVDSLNSTNFGTYPYPHVDIAFSDAPLPNTSPLTTSQVSFNPAAGWTTPGGGALANITLNSTFTTNAAYNVTNYGNPIQVPAFAVNVAIAVNTNDLTVNSAVTGVTGAAGSAIQLTSAQLCAIFSGLVTNWNDSSTMIPYVDDLGQPQQHLFDAANVGNGHSGQYSSASLPINVIYRSDGSGTSFILTNYLHNVCPLLDPPAPSFPNGKFGYTAIFGNSNLPSTTFFNLITNITNFRTGVSGPWNAVTSGSTTTTITSVGGAWLGENGSGGVAASVGTASAQHGFIGYVSADFSSPYSNPVSGAGFTNVSPPLSASLQDEDLRANGVYVPVTTSASGTNIFIAPTPAAAFTAWNDSRLRTPATTWTYNDYNIYGNTFTTTTTQGGVQLFGQSVLPLTNKPAAYPLAGTTFMTLYSCYNGSARVTAIGNFIQWYYDGVDTKVGTVIQAVGFNQLPGGYATNILAQYSLATGTTPIAAAGSAGACLHAAGAN